MTQSTQSSTQSAPFAHPKTASSILIADDDAANRRLLEAILKPEGFHLRSARDGNEALGIIEAGGVDLVLLDIMMPGKDGVEACRTIREDLGLTFLPVVLVTALNDSASRARGKAVGADDFISKPIYEQELLARVRSLLRTKALQDALEAQHRAAHYEARRWRLVSRVAELVASAGSLEQLSARLRDALGDDLPIAPPAFVFESDVMPDVIDGSLAIPLPMFDTAASAMLLVRPDGDEGKGFDDEDAELICSLAPHIANSIASVRFAEARDALDRAKERLASLLIHDLKNPLAVVQMNIDLVEEMAADELAGSTDETPTREMLAPLRDAAASARQLQRMTLDLLDISRAEDGRLPYSPSDCDVALLIESTSARFKSVVEREGASLVVGRPAGALSAKCDVALIERVLQNLVTNSARFVTCGGVVEVDVRETDGNIVFGVANNGPGLPDEMKAAIFQKYGQTNDSQHSANRGLGLYLCRLVAERHGGAMTVKDRAGGGVRFELAIPRH